MDLKWLDLAETVCLASKQMALKSLVTGSAGNISVRAMQQNRAVITPSGMRYETLSAEDMVVIGLDGKVVYGSHPPSSETPLHTLIYRHRPDVNAIVHTHSPFATSFSVLHEAIPLVSNEGLSANAVRIEITEFNLPGTVELGMAALDALGRNPGARAILIANHGVLTVGGDVYEAFNIAENVEREAYIYYLARSIGTPFTLSAEVFAQIKKNYASLRNKRE